MLTFEKQQKKCKITHTTFVEAINKELEISFLSSCMLKSLKTPKNYRQFELKI